MPDPRGTRRAKRGRRTSARPKQYTAAVVLSGLITLILATGAYKNDVFHAEKAGSLAISKSDRFAETRTGEILITSPDNGKCRRLFFNNETGTFSGEEGSCQDGFAARPVLAQPDNPVTKSLKNAFTR
jgi:hypothetical protein